MINRKKNKLNFEEALNAGSHGIMTFFSVAGCAVLIAFAIRSKEEWSLLSSIIYGLSLILLYFSSTIYHAVNKIYLKNKFRILDHASIYVLIAGTYTPVMLVSVGGTLGWTFFIIQWTMAITGIILKIFFTGRYEIVSLILYALMGWLVIIKIHSLYNLLPSVAFWLLLSGGLIYTLGIIFYVLDKKLKFSHFIWHLFVMGGSILHYLMISVYVI